MRKTLVATTGGDKFLQWQCCHKRHRHCSHYHRFYSWCLRFRPNCVQPSVSSTKWSRRQPQRAVVSRCGIISVGVIQIIFTSILWTKEPSPLRNSSQKTQEMRWDKTSRRQNHQAVEHGRRVRCSYVHVPWLLCCSLCRRWFIHSTFSLILT